MGRKRKQIDPDQASRSTLPPCRICNAPGAGFHYGANTCEACKGFFHRSLRLHTQYKCDAVGKCTIEIGQRRICQACRYQKCISVGMSKAAIKTGRYTSAKRTSDILEVKTIEIQKRLKKAKEEPAETEPGLNEAGASSNSSVPSGGKVAFKHRKRSHTHKKTHASESMGSEMLNPPEEVPQNDGNNSTDSRQTPGSKVNPAQTSSSTLPSSPPWSSLSKTKLASSTATSSDASNVPPVMESSSLLSPESMSPSTSLLDQLSPISNTMSTSPTGQAQLTQAFEHSVEMHIRSGNVSAPMADGSDELCLEEIYMDKDEVIRIICEAHKMHVDTVFKDIPKDIMLKQQEKHLEDCRLKQEIFGKLQHLPDQKYDEVFIETGIDVDDRQKMLNMYGESMEDVIRGMVKFAKCIPGFSRLELPVKVGLIKYSRQDFCIFSAFKYMHPKLKVCLGVDSKWKCMAELTTNVDDSLIERYFNFCGGLQDLTMSFEELAVLKAMIIMAPDRDPPVDSTLANDIYWSLTQCMIHVIGCSHPNPMLRFAKIMSFVTECRAKALDVATFFRSFKLDKYSSIQEKPLLKEMIDGIYFNVKTDSSSKDKS